MSGKRFEDWIDGQRAISKARLRESISATHLSHAREAFSQVVTPVKGSVLASPVSAHWNPEPDYFYHWVRDSAIAMNAVTDLARTAVTAAEQQEWAQMFRDYAAFSLATLQPKHPVTENPLLPATREELRQYLRTGAELSVLEGDAILKEPRFNPDGTPDLQNWARPQFDGPALRALACLRFLRFYDDRGGQISSLLKADLDFTLRHAGEPCIGPWEEDGQIDRHYFTGLCQLGALTHGIDFIDGSEAASKLRIELDRHWDDGAGFYKSLYHAPASFDAAQFMAALHAELPEGPHSLQDPRLHKTVATLESYFAEEYEVNKGRTVSLIGRNPEDRYFGNNPWFPTCFALAEYYYRLSPDGFEKGDEIMQAVRSYIPADGSLSEQFHRATGEPVSARHLTWSYAAFLGATQARREALEP